MRAAGKTSKTKTKRMSQLTLKTGWRDEQGYLLSLISGQRHKKDSCSTFQQSAETFLPQANHMNQLFFFLANSFICLILTHTHTRRDETSCLSPTSSSLPLVYFHVNEVQFNFPSHHFNSHLCSSTPKHSFFLLSCLFPDLQSEQVNQMYPDPVME